MVPFESRLVLRDVPRRLEPELLELLEPLLPPRGVSLFPERLLRVLLILPRPRGLVSLRAGAVRFLPEPTISSTFFDLASRTLAC